MDFEFLYIPLQNNNFPSLGQLQKKISGHGTHVRNDSEMGGSQTKNMRPPISHSVKRLSVNFSAVHSVLTTWRIHFRQLHGAIKRAKRHDEPTKGNLTSYKSYERCLMSDLV